MYHPMYGDVDQDDADSPHVVAFPRALHTARKSHHCDACGGVIAAGQRYFRESAVVDGVFEVLRAHDGGCPTMREDADELAHGDDLPF